MKIQSTLILGLFALAFMESCERSADISLSEHNSGAIAFSSYISSEKSRASATTALSLQESSDGFGVFAFHTGDAVYSEAFTPSFMHNQQVAYNDGKWRYSPIKYWPAGADEKISFFAYSPYCSDPSSEESGIVGISSNSHAGNPLLAYEINDDATRHVDLLYASAIDKTSEGGTIQLDFKHALCKVGFKLTGWEDDGRTYDDNTSVTVNAISLSTKRKGATLDLCTGQWSDPTEDEGRAFILSGDLLQNNVVSPSSIQGRSLNAEEAYLMLLPDLSEDGHGEAYCLLVDYTVSTVDPALLSGGLTVRNKVYSCFRPGFEQGKAYSINIKLGLNSSGGAAGQEPLPGDPQPIDPCPEADGEPTLPGNGGFVSFATEVTEWDDGNSLNLNESIENIPPRITLAQEDFHFNGSISSSRSSTDSYAIASIHEENSEINLLKSPFAIEEESFTIPCEAIKWEDLSSSSTLVFDFVKENGLEFSASTEITLASMAYEIALEEGSLAAGLPYQAVSSCPAILVSYGDGDVSPELTALTQEDISHEYAVPGTYLVKILSPNPDEAIQSPDFYRFPEQLSCIISPLLRSSQLKFDKTFTNCHLLETVPSNLFANNAEAITFSSTFENCSGLLEMPHDLFAGNTSATSFTGTFTYCKSLTSIPEELFKHCAGAKNFNNVFLGCEKIEEIPARLFSSNEGATNFARTFMGCKSLRSIPEGLFRRNPNIASFESAFESCASLRSLPADLFSYSSKIENIKGCFARSGIEEIPEHLLDNLTNVKKFDFLFYRTSIVSLPEDLFKHCSSLLSANCAFGGTPLASIPEGLFASCPKLSEVGGAFYDTKITEIPDGLFSSNPLLRSVYTSEGYTTYSALNTTSYVQSYLGVFEWCAELSSIPQGLFDSCPNITDFTQAFKDCQKISSPLPELWTRGNVRYYNKCFGGCYRGANFSDVPSDWK